MRRLRSPLRERSRILPVGSSYMRACVACSSAVARRFVLLAVCCLTLLGSASGVRAVGDLSQEKSPLHNGGFLRRVSITPEKDARQAKREAADEGLLQRQGRQNVPDITITYPVLGHAAVDEDVRRWVNSIADTFEEEMSSLFQRSEELGEPLDMSRYALHGSYSVLRPSQEAASLVFEIWTYTGGAHGNLDIITLNYSLITGQRLNFVDIFEDVDKALSLLSESSRKVLSRRLAGGRMDQWILDGTTQEVDNFSSIGLTAQGVRVYFQPYQVAAWAAGAQEVDIPLDDLLPAKPFLKLWDK